MLINIKKSTALIALEKSKSARTVRLPHYAFARVTKIVS